MTAVDPFQDLTQERKLGGLAGEPTERDADSLVIDVVADLWAEPPEQASERGRDLLRRPREPPRGAGQQRLGQERHGLVRLRVVAEHHHAVPAQELFCGVEDGGLAVAAGSDEKEPSPVNDRPAHQVQFSLAVYQLVSVQFPAELERILWAGRQGSAGHVSPYA
jgi:hypothetical protein